MGKVYAQIDEPLSQWILAQHMFFVATAPLAGDGLVNCSPKGLNSFAILDPMTVAYLDLTGSGVETIAHVRENGRIVIMFCSYETAPKIVRLHGRGEVFEPTVPKFATLRQHFPDLPGVRSIIRITLERISDSCGFGVPLYEYVADRQALVHFAEQTGADGLPAYRDKNNRSSIDGLPGVTQSAAVTE